MFKFAKKTIIIIIVIIIIIIIIIIIRFSHHPLEVTEIHKNWGRQDFDMESYYFVSTRWNQERMSFVKLIFRLHSAFITPLSCWMKLKYNEVQGDKKKKILCLFEETAVK